MTTTPRLCRSGSLSNVVVRPRGGRQKGDEEEDSRPIKAAMRWMKSPTKSSVAKQASRVERQNAMKKGFGSSTPRDPEQELEWSLMGDKAEAPETMSGSDGWNPAQLTPLS